MTRTGFSLALTALLLAACSQPATTRLKPGEVLLQVSASGRAEIQPDEAHLTLGVATTGDTAQAASAANSTAMQRVVTAITGEGVAAKDVQTRNLNLQRMDYGPDRGRYRAENMVEVTVRQVDKAGQVIAAATTAGANVAAGPDLRVSHPEGLEDSAHAAAYRAALGRAQAYAKAAGLKVRRVLTISDAGEPDDTPYMFNSRPPAIAAQAAPPPPISAGTTTREAQVRVDFALGK